MPKQALQDNHFMRPPDHPNYLRRAIHHDYSRPARYLITLHKADGINPFSSITGDTKITEGGSAPSVAVSPTGRFILDALETWLEKFWQIEIAEKCIMPDHIHLCINITEYLEIGLSRAMAGLMGRTSRLRHDALPDCCRPADITPVFSKGFNDKIAYTDKQWLAQINYTRDNPRRYLLKKQFPDFLWRRWEIRIGNDIFVAKGNIFLLREPWHFAAKHHRRWSQGESDEYQRQCRKQIDNGAVPISPFIHPKEKDIRDYAINTGGSYIRICENGFAERESATGREFELMASGRLLLIAPALHHTQKIDLKYARAQELNAIAASLAKICNSGLPGLLRPI